VNGFSPTPTGERGANASERPLRIKLPR